MNIFHSGWLSVGNVRRGYTSRDRFFSQGQPGGKKCLALCWQRPTGLYGLCLIRSSLVRTPCTERLRWSKEMADKETPTAHPMGCWLSMTRADIQSQRSEEKRAEASQGAAAIQQRAKNSHSWRQAHTHTHRQSPAVMSWSNDTTQMSAVKTESYPA